MGLHSIEQKVIDPIQSIMNGVWNDSQRELLPCMHCRTWKTMWLVEIFGERPRQESFYTYKLGFTETFYSYFLSKIKKNVKEYLFSNSDSTWNQSNMWESLREFAFRLQVQEKNKTIQLSSWKIGNHCYYTTGDSMDLQPLKSNPCNPKPCHPKPWILWKYYSLKKVHGNGLFAGFGLSRVNVTVCFLEAVLLPGRGCSFRL
jgi:hypothetical protein